MSNTIDKCIVITFFIVNNPYSCHPYMFITENCCSKFAITSFWAPVLNSPAENGIPEKSLDTSLLTMELQQRREKKWLKFKNQKLRTATDNNAVKNNFFSQTTRHNITGVEVVDNQSERKHSVEGKIQRKKSYTEIQKTDRNTAGKLEQNQNEGAVGIVANKGCVGVEFKVMKPILQTIVHKEGD